MDSRHYLLADGKQEYYYQRAARSVDCCDSVRIKTQKSRKVAGKLIFLKNVRLPRKPRVDDMR